MGFKKQDFRSVFLFSLQFRILSKKRRQKVWVVLLNLSDLGPLPQRVLLCGQRWTGMSGVVPGNGWNHLLQCGGHNSKWTHYHWVSQCLCLLPFFAGCSGIFKLLRVFFLMLLSLGGGYICHHCLLLFIHHSITLDLRVPQELVLSPSPLKVWSWTP